MRFLGPTSKGVCDHEKRDATCRARGVRVDVLINARSEGSMWLRRVQQQLRSKLFLLFDASSELHAVVRLSDLRLRAGG